jgi:peptide subunit release factor 1 (eRF1)
METLSQRDVQVLLDHPRGEGMVVTCYADTSVVQGFDPHWLGHFKSEASRVRQALAGNDDARDEFERNLKVIRNAFETPEARRAHGLAVFSSVAKGLFRSFELAVPVQHRLVVDEEMYLVPLIEALERGRECLVVLTDSHHGRIYVSTPSTTRLLREIEEIVPKQRRSSGQRRGKERGLAIERHRQDAILHYHKDLAHELEQAWNRSRFRGIVLLGHHDAVSQFRNRMPVQLASHVFHEGPQSWNGDRSAINSIVQSAITKAIEAHDQRTLAEITGRLAEGHAATAGPQEVLDALRNGRVSYVVLGPDPGQLASHCPACGWTYAAAKEVCSFCRSRCEKANLWQQILSLALRHDVSVHFVKMVPELSDRGGVAAALTRED